MFQFHMTRLTDRYQIFQSVCLYRIGKQTIRFDMMNGQVFSFLFSCLSTYLASMIITVTSGLALLFPGWATSQLPIGIRAINIPGMLCWMFLMILTCSLCKFLSHCLWAGNTLQSGISPLSLHDSHATARTRFSLLRMACFDIEQLSTCYASQLNFRFLYLHSTGIRAIASLFSCLNNLKGLAAVFTYFCDAMRLMQTIASFRTEAAIYRALNNLKGLLAIFTRFQDTGYFTLCITDSRAKASCIFLGKVDDKRLLTLFTYLCDMSSQTLGIACMRTEAAIFSCRSRFKGMAAYFTVLENALFFHISSIS